MNGHGEIPSNNPLPSPNEGSEQRDETETDFPEDDQWLKSETLGKIKRYQRERIKAASKAAKKIVTDFTQVYEKNTANVTLESFVTMVGSLDEAYKDLKVAINGKDPALVEGNNSKIVAVGDLNNFILQQLSMAADKNVLSIESAEAVLGRLNEIRRGTELDKKLFSPQNPQEETVNQPSQVNPEVPAPTASTAPTVSPIAPAEVPSREKKQEKNPETSEHIPLTEQPLTREDFYTTIRRSGDISFGSRKVSSAEVIKITENYLRQLTSDDFKRKPSDEQWKEIQRILEEAYTKTGFDIDLWRVIKTEGIAPNSQPKSTSHIEGGFIERVFRSVDTEKEFFEVIRSPAFQKALGVGDIRMKKVLEDLSQEFSYFHSPEFQSMSSADKRSKIDSDFARLPDGFKNIVVRILENERLLGDNIVAMEGAPVNPVNPDKPAEKPPEGLESPAQAETPNTTLAEFFDGHSRIVTDAQEQQKVDQFDAMATLNSDPNFAAFVAKFPEADRDRIFGDGEKVKAYDFYETFKQISLTSDTICELAKTQGLNIGGEQVAMSFDKEGLVSLRDRVEHIAFTNPQKYEAIAAAIKTSAELDKEHAQLKAEIDKFTEGKNLEDVLANNKRLLEETKADGQLLDDASYISAGWFMTFIEKIFSSRKAKGLARQLKDANLPDDLRVQYEAELKDATKWQRRHEARKDLKDVDIGKELRFTHDRLKHFTETVDSLEDFSNKKTVLQNLLRDARAFSMTELRGTEEMAGFSEEQIVRTIQKAASSKESKPEELARAWGLAEKIGGKNIHTDPVAERAVFEKLKTMVAVDMEKMISGEILKGDLFKLGWLDSIVAMTDRYTKQKQLGSVSAGQMNQFFRDALLGFAARRGTDSQKKFILTTAAKRFGGKEI